MMNYTRPTVCSKQNVGKCYLTSQKSDLYIEEYYKIECKKKLKAWLLQGLCVKSVTQVTPSLCEGKLC